MQIHRMLQLLTTRVFLHSTYRHLVRVQYYLDNMMMASSAQLPMIFSLLTVLQDASNRVGLGLLTDAVVFSCVSDFLSPDAETESDIRGGPLQDIWQHSDHTHPARRYVHALVYCTQLQLTTSYLMVLMYMYVPFECALITTDPLPLCRPSSEVPRDEIGWRVH